MKQIQMLTVILLLAILASCSCTLAADLLVHSCDDAWQTSDSQITVEIQNNIAFHGNALKVTAAENVSGWPNVSCTFTQPIPVQEGDYLVWWYYPTGNGSVYVDVVDSTGLRTDTTVPGNLEQNKWHMIQYKLTDAHIPETNQHGTVANISKVRFYPRGAGGIYFFDQVYLVRTKIKDSRDVIEDFETGSPEQIIPLWGLRKGAGDISGSTFTYDSGQSKEGVFAGRLDVSFDPNISNNYLALEKAKPITLHAQSQRFIFWLKGAGENSNFKARLVLVFEDAAGYNFHQPVTLVDFDDWRLFDIALKPVGSWNGGTSITWPATLVGFFVDDEADNTQSDATLYFDELRVMPPALEPMSCETAARWVGQSIAAGEAWAETDFNLKTQGDASVKLNFLAKSSANTWLNVYENFPVKPDWSRSRYLYFNFYPHQEMTGYAYPTLKLTSNNGLIHEGSDFFDRSQIGNWQVISRDLGGKQRAAVDNLWFYVHIPALKDRIDQVQTFNIDHFWLSSLTMVSGSLSKEVVRFSPERSPEAKFKVKFHETALTPTALAGELKVYNGQGALVRTAVINGPALPAATYNLSAAQVTPSEGELIITWDGCDDNGQLVADGAYDFVLNPFTKLADGSQVDLAEQIQVGGFIVDTTAPPAPSNLQGSDTHPSAKIDLSWEHSLNGDWDHFNIYRSSVPFAGGLGEPYASLTNTSLSDLLVVHQTSYYYAVTAVDDLGNESAALFSEAIIAVDTLAPLPPSDVNIDLATADRVLISWRVPTAGQDEELAVTYQIYRMEIDADWQVLTTVDAAAARSGDLLTYIDRQLTYGKEYRYKIYGADLNENQSPAVEIMDFVQPTLTKILLKHIPVTKALAGVSLLVEVFGITDGGELEISLLYRAKGSTEYLELSMAKEEGKYVAIIPAEKTQASGLEYYFKADNGTKVVFLSQSGEGEPHPFSVEVSAYETGLGVEDLTVSPNPFLLQARDEAVAINYLLTAEAQVSIKIYNLRGRLIKSFSASGQQRGTQRLLWDGRDYNGRLIPSGSYLVQIEARGEETRAVVRRLKAVLVLR